MAHDRLELQNRNDDKFQASNSQQQQPRMDTNLYERGGAAKLQASNGVRKSMRKTKRKIGASGGLRHKVSAARGPCRTGPQVAATSARTSAGRVAACQGNIQGQAGRQATSSLVKPFNLKKLFP